MSVDLMPHHPPISPNSPGRVQIELEAKLPLQIDISVTGKNQGQDTLLDDQNNIVDDLFVKLNNISLDSVPVPSHVLQKIITFRTESGKILKANYWGFNGIATLTLDQNNVFDQIMTWNRYIL